MDAIMIRTRDADGVTLSLIDEGDVEDDQEIVGVQIRGKWLLLPEYVDEWIPRALPAPVEPVPPIDYRAYLAALTREMTKELKAAIIGLAIVIPIVLVINHFWQ